MDNKDMVFNLIACDLSMRCPGFALMQYTGENRSVKV